MESSFISNRRRTRWLGGPVLLIGMLVTIEVGLQLVAAALWWKNRPTAPWSEGRRVLCVGDSYTYGIGTTDRKYSYPSQLETLLQTADGKSSWSVWNGGWPGQNSAEVLQRLVPQVRDGKPDLVCLLVGVNNRWKENGMRDPLPDPHATEDDSGAWRWTFRTGRLVQIAWHRWSPRTLDAPTDRFPAVKREQAEAWRPLRESLDLSPFLSDRGRAPVVATDDSPHSSQSSPTQGLPPPAEREAVALVQRAVQEVRKGDREVALNRVRTLDASLDDFHGAEFVEAYMGLLRILGLYHEAAQWGLARVGEIEPSAAFLTDLGQALLHGTNPKESLPWLARAVEQEPWHPRHYQVLADALLLAREPREALKATLIAFALGGHCQTLRNEVGKQAPEHRMSREEIQRILDEVPLGPRHRTFAEEVTLQSGPGSVESYRAHVEHMLRVVREFDAQPVLLTYPRPGRGWLPRINATVREIAAEQGVALVDSEQTFLQALKSSSPSELFQEDNHCTDRGYRLLAGAVAKVLAQPGTTGDSSSE